MRLKRPAIAGAIALVCAAAGVLTPVLARATTPPPVPSGYAYTRQVPTGILDPAGLALFVSGNPGHFICDSGCGTGGSTVTANIGTTGGLALDASVQSLLTAQGTSNGYLAIVAGAVSPPGQTTMSASTSVAIASDQSAVKVNPDSNADDFVWTGTASANATPIGTPPTAAQIAGMHMAVINVTSAGGGGTLTPQESFDNANWFGVAAWRCDVNGGVPGTTIGLTANTSYCMPLFAPYWHVNLSSYVSGTIALNVGFKRYFTGLPAAVMVGAGTGFAAQTDSSPPIKVGGTIYTTPPTAGTNGQKIATEVTPDGKTVTRPFANSTLSWTASVTLSSTTSTALHASCGAGLRNYLTDLSVSGNATAVADTLTVLDGATGLWGANLAAAQQFVQQDFQVTPTGSAATAMNAQLSGAPTGAFIVNASGYCGD